MAAGGHRVDVGWTHRVGPMGGGGKPPFFFGRSPSQPMGRRECLSASHPGGRESA
ncbi:hypothetical protein [Azospirillum palustre]